MYTRIAPRMRIKVNISESMKNLSTKKLSCLHHALSSVFTSFSLFEIWKTSLWNLENLSSYNRFTLKWNQWFVCPIQSIDFKEIHFNQLILIKYISIDWFCKTINYFSHSTKYFHKNLFFKTNSYLIQWSSCILLTWWKQANMTLVLRLKSYPS